MLGLALLLSSLVKSGRSFVRVVCFSTLRPNILPGRSELVHWLTLRVRAIKSFSAQNLIEEDFGLIFLTPGFMGLDR